MKCSRRFFVISSTVGLSAACAVPLVHAMAGPVVDEKSPQAIALGYKADATQIDKSKYPSYAAGQSCGNCTQFQGKPGISAGPCTIFANKPVLTNGWCSSYAKKG